MSPEDYQDVLADMRANKWLDLATRYVFLDYAVYNPNLDFFMSSRTIALFLPTGVVRTSSTFRTLILDRYPLDSVLNFILIGPNEKAPPKTHKVRFGRCGCAADCVVPHRGAVRSS